jgi:lactosylceramide 4-alpha-galactosyltransferase
MEHFSDYIRILSLFKGILKVDLKTIYKINLILNTLHKKGGGMYMDLDFITLRSFDGGLFRNFVPKEDDSRVLYILFFEKLHFFL